MVESSVVIGCIAFAALLVLCRHWEFFRSRVPGRILSGHFFQPPDFLNKTRKSMEIMDIRHVSPDTKVFRLSLGNKRAQLGLPIGKHMIIYAPNPRHCLDTGLWNEKPDQDKGKAEIARTYTPITGDETLGYVDLMIKCYAAGTKQMPDGREFHWPDGGKMGCYLDTLRAGQSIEVFGPVGVHHYLGQGRFKVPGRVVDTKHICMLAGGVGITPILQIVNAALRDPVDKCSLTLLYANKTYDDILARELLVEAEARSGGRFQVHYTLDFPPENWTGLTGFITAEMIKDIFVGPSELPAVVMCGPPPMIEFACKKNLEVLGYPKNCWIAM